MTDRSKLDAWNVRADKEIERFAQFLEHYNASETQPKSGRVPCWYRHARAALMGDVRYPKVGSAAVVFNEIGALLLGRRGKQPNYGKWVMPGGKVEWGETIDEAVVREVQEETGLVVTAVERLGIFEIVSEEECSVFVLTRCEPTIYGRLKAGDDLQDVGWWMHPEEALLSDPCRAALTEVGIIKPGSGGTRDA